MTDGRTSSVRRLTTFAKKRGYDVVIVTFGAAYPLLLLLVGFRDQWRAVKRVVVPESARDVLLGLVAELVIYGHVLTIMVAMYLVRELALEPFKNKKAYALTVVALNGLIIWLVWSTLSHS